MSAKKEDDKAVSEKDKQSDDAESTSSQKSEDENQPKAHEQASDPWPLEADRMAIQSPLIECLKTVSGHYGRRVSKESLVAGLPVPKIGITPTLFVRAAERADMDAKLAEKSLEAIAISPNLPCIAVLDKNQACIIWDIKIPKGKAPEKKAGEEIVLHPDTCFEVEFPETPSERQIVSIKRLESIYSGYSFFVRPWMK